LTLWGVRARIIADPAGANGDVPTGSHTTLQLVTDGMKGTPINPTFTDARDAILDADCAANACANEVSIWAGFADRGLGYGSAAPYSIIGRYTSSHESVHESFSSPFLDVVSPAGDVTIDDSADNNNGVIDPGEAVKMTVKLTNPWRAASKAVASATATLTTSTPGVTIYTSAATYGAIAPSASGTAFVYTVASSVPCGSGIDFTLTTVSNLGTTATTFRVWVGNANGTDPQVTYTNSTPTTIVSDQPRGVATQIIVTDDFQVSQVKFRIDSLTHPSVGDLSAMLRSPQGTGVDLIALTDAFSDLGGTSFLNTLIDDTVAASAATDLVQAVSSDAPYTRSWLPVYNAPWAGLFNPAVPADAVGNLTRYAGKSSKGTWTNLVADNYSSLNGAGTDGNGTLNSWSILLTPVHYDCSAFVATPVVSAKKAVSGTFTVGATVTYVVTISNSGTAAITDNAGHEFTDVLPGSLALVSAVASSGTATTAGNTVNWDGVVAPLGGIVTITITATINAGTESTVISNQGTVSYDADGNGTNESSLLTDDPAVGGGSDPTSFTVYAPPYIALNPARLLDTRPGYSTIDGLNAGAGPVSGGGVVDLPVLGRGGVALTNVKAVVLNVTATQAASTGFVTVWPTGQTRPLVSNVSFKPLSDVPNSVVVATGTGGKVSLFVSNSGVSSNLVVDVVGYFTNSSSLTLIPAARFLDTRTGATTIDGAFAGGGALAAQATLDLTMDGRGTLPASGVGAVFFNLTATNTTDTGFATAYPTGSARPAASNLNFVPASTVPNLVLSQVGTGGKVTIFSSRGPTDYIADVQAWFPPGMDLTSVIPARILDTRTGRTTIDGQYQAIGALTPGGILNLTVVNRASVPASGVGAVVLNVTVTQPTGMGFVQVWPTGDTRPTSSSVNFNAGETRANLVIAKVGTGGQISIFNSHGGSSDVIADVVGWLPAPQ